jgi:hypothetical protein
MFDGIFISLKDMISSPVGSYDPFISKLGEAHKKCQMISYPTKTSFLDGYNVLKQIYSEDPLSLFSLAETMTPKVISGIIVVIDSNDLDKFVNPDESINQNNIRNGSIMEYCVGYCLIQSRVDVNSVYKCAIYDVCVDKDNIDILYSNRMQIEDEVGPTSSDVFEAMIFTLLRILPNNAILWLAVDFNNTKFIEASALYAKFGFRDPYVTYVDCFGKDYSTVFPNGFIAMIRENDYEGFVKGANTKRVLSEIVYIVQQQINMIDYKRKNPLIDIDINCNIILRYNKDNAAYLRQLVLYTNTFNLLEKEYKTMIYGVKNIKIEAISTTQKEVGGIMTVLPVCYNKESGIECVKIKNTDNIIWEIYSVPGTKNFGGETNVNVNPAKYTFHTHPKGAYMLESIKIGFPSSLDYALFLRYALLNDALLHSVITVEGIYTLSLNEYWCIESNFKELKRFFLFVFSNNDYLDIFKIFWQKMHSDLFPFGVDPPKTEIVNKARYYSAYVSKEVISNDVINAIITKVNKPLVKSDEDFLKITMATHPLFNCQFLTYEEIDMNTTFKISYARNGSPPQCFTTEANANNYNNNQSFTPLV